MITNVVHVFGLVCCVLIAYEDYKKREVYAHWLFFLIVANAYVLYDKIHTPLYLVTILINFVFILVIMLSLYLYAKFKMRKKIFDVFGSGDLLMFIAYAVGFGNISFLVLTFFSVFMSLIISFILKTELEGVPLAGHMAVFLFVLNFIILFFDTRIVFNL